MRATTWPLLALLAGCAGPGTELQVPVPPHQGVAGAFAPAPPGAISVAAFAEPGGTGVLPGAIGERSTIGDISMGQVRVSPPPARLLRDAVVADLIASGWNVLPGGPAPAELAGTVPRFALRTDATALYWDVILDAGLGVRLAAGGRQAAGDFAAHCQERTYVWPGSEIIARVVAQCVDELARDARQDAGLARALGAP